MHLIILNAILNIALFTCSVSNNLVLELLFTILVLIAQVPESVTSHLKVGGGSWLQVGNKPLITESLQPIGQSVSLVIRIKVLHIANLCSPSHSMQFSGKSVSLVTWTHYLSPCSSMPRVTLWSTGYTHVTLTLCQGYKRFSPRFGAQKLLELMALTHHFSAPQ